MEIPDSPFKVLIRTGKKDKVHGFVKEKGAIVLDISAPPEKGKANLAILKLLRKHYKKQVRIKSGHTSKRKVIEFLD